MTRFRIDHPSRRNIYADAGHDQMLGFFVDIMREGRDRPVKSYDHFSPSFNRARPLMGCLDFLVSEGFFTGENLEDAITALHEPVDVPDELAAIAEVVMNFKRAAD